MSAPVTCSITIDRGIEEVWAALDDLSQRPRWQHAVSEAVSDDGRALHAGSRVHERRRVAGLPARLSWVVTTWEVPHRRGFAVVAGLASPVGEWTLSSLAGTRTRLVTSTDYATTRRTALIGRVLASALAREEQADLDRLKSWLESEPDASPSSAAQKTE